MADDEKEPETGKDRDTDSEARSRSESDSQDSMSARSKEKDEVEHMNATCSHLGTKKMARKKTKKGRRLGGVDKRRMSRRPRRKPNRRGQKARNDSTLTIYSRGRSPLLAEQICKYCGHRCCLRSSQYEKGEYPKKSKKGKGGKTAKLRITSAVGVQAGSRAAMLSPLIVKAYQPPEPNAGAETVHSAITPEMIYLAVRELNMWRQDVPTLAIFDYIQSNYPVNPNPVEVMDELREKLRVASIVGIIWALPNDCWRLSTALERINKLDQTHITIFWKMYADTLKPLEWKRAKNVHRADKQTGSNGTKEPVNSDTMDFI